MGEGSKNDTVSSQGNSTSRSHSVSSARGSGGRPATAPTPQRTSNSVIRQRVAERNKVREAQFLGRESLVSPKNLPPFWSAQKHGVPYNEGDPLDIARGAVSARGTRRVHFEIRHRFPLLPPHPPDPPAQNLAPCLPLSRKGLLTHFPRLALTKENQTVNVNFQFSGEDRARTLRLVSSALSWASTGRANLPNVQPT